MRKLLKHCWKTQALLLIVCNLTPVPHHGYRIGLPCAGQWEEILNTDAEMYAGSNVGNGGGVRSEPVAYHHQKQSALFTLPPLGCCVFKFNYK